MNKTFAAVAAISLALLAGGCSNSKDPVAVATITTTAEAAPATKSNQNNEDDYISMLYATDVPFGSRDIGIALGNNACEMLTKGETPSSVSISMFRTSDGVFTLEESASLVGSAIAFLCPEHTDKVRK